MNSGLKPAPEFQQRRDAAVDRHRSRSGREDSGDHLQQGALAGAVFADDAEGFAALHLEADVVQRPEILVALQAVERQQFLEPVARRVVDRVAFGNTLEFNGVHNVEVKKPV